MQQAIIDEHLIHLPVSPYKYLTILATKDIYNNDVLKFKVDITTFSTEKKEQLYSLLRFFYLSKSENLLPILDSEVYTIDEEKTYFECICQVPKLTTVSSYYSRNKCLETEMKAHILNTLEIYEYLSNANIPVEVSFDNISILLTQSKYPFPRLIITPYAAFKAFFNMLEGKEYHIHMSYANLFKFFDDRLEEMKEKGLFGAIGKAIWGSKQPFDGIVKTLLADNDAKQLLYEHEYVKKAQTDLELPTFNMRDLKLVKELGQGAFGAVCWVITKENVNYAMKQCEEYNSDDLFKEAFIMYDMHHRNIIKMNGFMLGKQNIKPEWENGETRGFMLMEMCQHGDLENYIESFTTGYIPINTIKLIFGQIADAVIYLHSKRYVHRDLKTANVLMEQIVPFPWIKICDFGLATSNDSIIQGYIGTPLTMDTRTLKGENYTDRADLFSIGCILYALIYKRYPGESCQSKEQLIHLLETKQIDYSLKKGMTNDYLPLIDLTRYLFEQTDKKLKVGERRDNEVFWKEFKKHPVVKECMDVAQKRMKIYTD